MSKEENDINKEGQDMPAIIENSNSFSDFTKKNRDKIRKISQMNSIRNEDGHVVIPKGDIWRNEKEWDEILKRDK